MDDAMNRGRIMIIGAGGVATVAAHKCAQVPGAFRDIMIASRTLSKCEAIGSDIRSRYGREVRTAQVDADNVAELAALMRSFEPDVVLNLALPYQDLHIGGVHGAGTRAGTVGTHGIRGFDLSA